MEALFCQHFLSTQVAPAPRARLLAHGNEPASPGAVDARRHAVAATRGTRRDVCLTTGSNLFVLFSTQCESFRFAIFGCVVGAKHHGTVQGAHRERAPLTGDHDGDAVERRSTEGGRGAGATRACVSALRCVPHRARALAPSPTCRPTVRLTILPSRRRRPERNDGVHQPADRQRGVVTGYVALLSPAKRAAKPRASPSGLTLAGSRATSRCRRVDRARSRRDFFLTRRTNAKRMQNARDAPTTRTPRAPRFPTRGASDGATRA